MTAARGVRDDVRLEDAPMQPVACGACGAQVEARKSSWDQTSLQWTARALAACHERADARPRTDRPNRHAFAGCSALGDSVRKAAVRGLLDVRSDEPPVSHPEGPR